MSTYLSFRVSLRKAATIGAVSCTILTAQSVVHAKGTPPAREASVRATRSAPIATPSSTGGGGGGGGGGGTSGTKYYEQSTLIRAGESIPALGPNLMGDKVNEYNGSLEFDQTDVSLPGNNSLPVMVGRRLSTASNQPALAGGLFGDWDIDIPHLHTVAGGTTNNWYGSSKSLQRCSQFAFPPALTGYSAGTASPIVDPNAWWDGYHLSVPGSSTQTLLGRYAYATPVLQPTDGATYPVLTKDHYQLSCLSSLANDAGEGFVARGPDGTTYQFDHLAKRGYPTYQSESGGTQVNAGRSEVWIMPSRVSDRFGNSVTYTYDPSDAWKLVSIASSDGRSISLTYVDGSHRVQTVSDGTRTWSYAYNGDGTLASVTLPDSSAWGFALQALEHATPLNAWDPGCGEGDFDVSHIDPNSHTGILTHPSGATGSFTHRLVWHGTSNVPGSYDGCETSNKLPLYALSYSLTAKTLSGPGLPAMTWSYAYDTPNGSWAPVAGNVVTTTVTTVDPSNNTTQNTYGTQYGLNEGLLLSSSEGVSGGNALRTTSMAYAAATAGPYPAVVGLFNTRGDAMSAVWTPLSQRTVSQQGATFSHAVSGFDIYARETGATKSSSLGFSKSESTAYSDNTNAWVLGQVASQTIAGVQASSTTFDAATALPTASYQFGKLQGSYAFNADGTLANITDGLNHTTSFSNYMRGLAQRIDYADGTSMSAVVNNLGLLTSVTNEAGTTWSYGYDAMGRLASKTPPAGDAVDYHPTTLSFVQVPSAEVGLDANHWRQTITTGNAVTVNYFDARWRKRLTTTYDAANPGATQRSQRFDYDPYNRTTFAAYPARSIASITSSTPGTATAYDALGRPTQTQADSELGTLTTTLQYLSGFQKQVTNPRNYVTTSSYQAFDEPSEEALAAVSAPEGLTVSIARDVFGKPTAITRSGSYAGSAVSATRAYVYDTNQRLCKTVEPELGATIQSLDAADNLSWRATGLSATGTSTCDYASATSDRIVGYAYDARNRLTGIGFGDNSPSIGRSYTADGLPLTVVSNGSTWTYAYNNRRLPTQETLAYNQSYSIAHAYDANGHESALTYPDGVSIAFAPNALGEATQAGGLASGVGYFPNGAVAGYTLGNGITHSASQNTRGLTSLNADAGILQDAYGYDANGNIISIADQLSGAASRTMGYDGLDRLTAANSPGVWGTASYAYDALDNLRTSVVGGRSTVHTYDASNRLATLAINGAYTGFAYDAQGNVTGRGAQGFYFDEGNRLQLANGVASYVYDGLGRRVGSTDQYGFHASVYDSGGQLLYTTTEVNGTVQATRLIYLAGKLIAEQGSAGTSYVSTDALGSPVARTNAGAQVQSVTRYEPYGGVAAGANSADVGFTGHVNEPLTGLVYMQQRYYDPVAGRFFSVDPVVTDTSADYFNRYEYAYNNPYRYTDPDGRCPVCVVALPTVIDAIAAWAATNTGAAVIGVAGGASIAAAINSGSKPSTLTPGSNAADSIPARGPGRDFSKGERGQVNGIGNDTGCHTCGAQEPGTKSGNWVPDHQPPTGLNESEGPQRLYPHCQDCSRTQGGQVTGAKSKGNSSNSTPSGESPSTGSSSTTSNFQGVFQVSGRIESARLDQITTKSTH